MQLVGNMGRVHRLIYFFAGLAAIAGAWIAHDLLSKPEIFALLILGALLLWSARAGH
jgi:drug/metabolite transporter superfamily protein YnfA